MTSDPRPARLFLGALAGIWCFLFVIFYQPDAGAWD